MLTMLRNGKAPGFLFAGFLLLQSCNKDLPVAIPAGHEPNGVSPTLANLISDPTFSIFKSAVAKAGMMGMLDDPTLRLTVFAPDNAALAASGFSQAVIDALPAPSVTGIVSYHILPQSLSSASIPTNFPNLQYPSMLNPKPGVPLLRLTVFPSKRAGSVFVNNVPINTPDIPAVNGVMHKIAVILMPPTQFLWDRINSDPNLTFFNAAIIRADSGVAAGKRLRDALDGSVSPAAIASNLTIFAPTDDAMKNFLKGSLTRAFISNGFPAANAAAAAELLVTNFGSLLLSNPASIPDVAGFPPGIGAQIAAVITPKLAGGIVAYHILSAQTGTYAPPGIRLFSVNFPDSDMKVKTLLNSNVAADSGISLQATFGAAGLTAATVQGAANTSAANVLINPRGTSDQQYLNGIIHEIDQVLVPKI